MVVAQGDVPPKRELDNLDVWLRKAKSQRAHRPSQAKRAGRCPAPKCRWDGLVKGF